jgi:6-pyruvoyltetrahydropterin/6-carboxytetrahydropterin synthase
MTKTARFPVPYILKLTHSFQSAHKILNHPGACATLHGHRWTVEVTIATDELNDDMVVDFDRLKAIIDQFDHKNLNEVVDFNPTAENLAKHLKEKIDRETGLISEITLWESPEAAITYKS